MAKKKNKKKQQSPLLWIGIAVAAVIIVASILALSSGSGTLPGEIDTDTAFEKYNNGAFLLDVRTPAEWDEYHAPNTTLIPLDELESRVNEVPKDQEIVVVCRSGNRSQVGRDILLEAGFEKVTSLAGGLNSWRSAGYPIESGNQ